MAASSHRNRQLACIGGITQQHDVPVHHNWHMRLVASIVMPLQHVFLVRHHTALTGGTTQQRTSVPVKSYMDTRALAVVQVVVRSTARWPAGTVKVSLAAHFSVGCPLAKLILADVDQAAFRVSVATDTSSAALHNTKMVSIASNVFVNRNTPRSRCGRAAQSGPRHLVNSTQQWVVNTHSTCSSASSQQALLWRGAGAMARAN